MIPGSNLLNRALKVIKKQSASWYKFLNRTINAIGNEVPVYANAVTIYGSLQPADNTLIQNLGLNLEYTYFVFYTSNEITDLIRGSSGDQLVINNKQYQCETITPWFEIDGWVRVICRYVGAPNL
jgi:hypothetical protein